MKKGSWTTSLMMLGIYGIGIFYGYKIGVAKGELDAYTGITNGLSEILDECIEELKVEEKEEG